MSDAEWASLADAAAALGLSRQTLLRQLQDPAIAAEVWGDGNWRRRPLYRRKVYQVRTARVAELAEEAGQPWPPESG